MTFTHNNPNDTMLERDGDVITFSFVIDPFTMETDDFEFRMTQEELMDRLRKYFDAGENRDLFDDLTLPEQDALWNALYTLTYDLGKEI